MSNGTTTEWRERLARMEAEGDVELEEVAAELGYDLERVLDPDVETGEHRARRMVERGLLRREAESGERHRDVRLSRAGSETGPGGRSRARVNVGLSGLAEDEYAEVTELDWRGRTEQRRATALLVLRAFGVMGADGLHERFAEEVVGNVPREGGRLTRDEVLAWVRGAEAEPEAEAAEPQDSDAEPDEDEPETDD